MASSAIMYFAGVGTVVAALGLGFGGGVMLVSTEPAQKHDAAAFAKREQLAEQPSAQVTTTAATSQVSPPPQIATTTVAAGVPEHVPNLNTGTATPVEAAASVAKVEPSVTTEPVAAAPAAAVVAAPAKNVADVSTPAKAQTESSAQTDRPGVAAEAEHAPAIKKTAQRKTKKTDRAIARQKVPNEELDDELIGRDRDYDRHREFVERDRRMVDPEGIERHREFAARNRRVVDPEGDERELSYTVESEPRRGFLFGLFGD